LGDDAERRSDVQILEVEEVTELAPALKESAFFLRALSVTQQILGRRAKLLYDHCIIKPGRNRKETAWHQDCAYFRRFSLQPKRLHWWLPLQDVTEQNGCMQFVKRSHLGGRLPHVALTKRAHSLRTELPGDGEVICCPLRAGGVTIHLPRTVHCTGANETAEPRLAWIVQIGLGGFLSRLVT
jgi:ectoine hydroxylase-related dioxygenase (phytanoyl-CoA dioxygenase family)